jgi:hypothetical protein
MQLTHCSVIMFWSRRESYIGLQAVCSLANDVVCACLLVGDDAMYLTASGGYAEIDHRAAGNTSNHCARSRCSGTASGWTAVDRLRAGAVVDTVCGAHVHNIIIRLGRLERARRQLREVSSRRRF